MEKESLDLEQIKGVLGERPFGMPDDVKQILNAKADEEQEQKPQTK